MRVVFVHGACVKGGAWWWHRTGELLTERGITSEAPALPSCGETGVPAGVEGPGLTEDVAAVRQLLAASDEPTVMVAHSYGGRAARSPSDLMHSPRRSSRTAIQRSNARPWTRRPGRA